MSNTIQFKRNLTYKGTYDEARVALQSIELSEGEPILVSYLDDSTLKYFVAIGVGDGSMTILPTYSSLDELNNNINTLIQTFLNTYSYDWVSDIDVENSNVIFNRDSETGSITVNYTGSGGTSGYATELETTIKGTNMTQQEFNDLVYECLEWGNIQ